MNTSTGWLFAPCILLHTVLAHAADPAAAIADCRARHAEEPGEHIACLERELRALGGAGTRGSQPSLGAEQLRTKEPKETVEQVTVQIENVTDGFDGMGSFRLKDGQIWKATQSTPRERRLEPRRSYSARIERGKLGGYRMYVEGAPGMIRVVRMQ